MARIDLYEILFPEVEFDYTENGNTQVCCPFPHYVNGQAYYETNPSAGIKISKGLFHCFSCDKGFNKLSFTKEYFNVNDMQARDLINLLENSDSLLDWQTRVDAYNNSIEAKTLTAKLHFSPKIVEQLRIGYSTKDAIDIPIIYKGRVVDRVQYRPNQVPKYKRNAFSISGTIFPYDLWQNTKTKQNYTIICAGEKDCICARDHGFNAISFTGGEGYVPNLFLNDFKDKKIYIIYDNDETGRIGAKKVAFALRDYAREIHIVDLSPVCINDKEDLWDYFNKYGKTQMDFLQLLKSSTALTDEDYKIELNKMYPLVDLHTATTSKYLNKLVRSNIQVIATADQIFSLPTEITGTKGNRDDENHDKLRPGETRRWELTEDNFKDILYLISSGLKETQIETNIRTLLLKIGTKETNITIKKRNIKPVYGATVTDIPNPIDSAPLTEFSAFSINQKLENGKKYIITYKLVPHPQDGQKLMMIIKDVEESDEFLDNFKITTEVKSNLQVFQPEQDKDEEKFNDTIERVKGLLHADYNNSLIEIIDLWFHTVLQFNVGAFKNIRGYLDALVVGESRIGKSSTVTALQETYDLGRIVSLAGNAATPASLIGGSNVVRGSYQTRAGLIPQNNKGAIILEELIKCNSNIIRELTEIRSSGKVRISRVNGSIELPALVRMLTLTNPKPIDGMSKPISEYPNGISILTDIVGTAEDIARYDIIAIFGFDADKPIDPFFEPKTPYTKEQYKTRIRWIWSRKPEQIIITPDIYRYTNEECNKVNETYKSHIKIFGIESWKKVMRLAIAIAGYLVSTDDTFENIIVKKYHIDKAIKILISLYDNSTFKFKEYCNEENKYKGATEEDIKNLQNLYMNHSIIIDTLNTTTSISRSNLQAVSGVSTEGFNRIINILSRNRFISLSSYNVSATDKLKKAYLAIDRQCNKPKEVTINVDLV